MAEKRRRALVTGGNRGIGLEVCRQLGQAGLQVILGAREAARGRAAAQALRAEGLDVDSLSLDVTREASVRRALARLAQGRQHVDVLVNNAGIYPQASLLRAETATLQAALATHLLGPWWLAQGLLPGMRRARYGRIVNVSTGYASFAAGLQGPPAYAISKAALNALTVKLAQEAGDRVKVNAADPGWVRTRMGGAGANLDPAEAARGIVWLATLPADGPSGGFFRHGRPAEW